MEEIKPSRFRIEAAKKYETANREIPASHPSEEMFVLKLFDFINSDDNKKITNYRFASCMLKIISDTLFAMPEMNVKWKPGTEKDDIKNIMKEDPKIIKYDELNLGLALETRIGGEPSTTVVTVKGLVEDWFIDARHMNLHQINKCVLALAQKAKTGKFTQKDFEPKPNIVFNNLGTFENIKNAVPLLTCSLMISTLRAEEKQVYLGLLHGLAIRRMMPVVVSFDHRLFDGPKINKFMGVLKSKIENPHF